MKKLSTEERTRLLNRGAVLDDVVRMELRGQSVLKSLKCLDRKALLALAGGDFEGRTVERALGRLMDRAAEQPQSEHQAAGGPSPT